MTFLMNPYSHFVLTNSLGKHGYLIQEKNLHEIIVIEQTVHLQLIV